MTKSLRLPLVALLAASTLFASAPASQAALNHKSLLSKIYKTSEDGDGTDIKELIAKYLRKKGTKDGKRFLRKLFAELNDNRDQLHPGVTKEDLDRIFKSSVNYVEGHPFHESKGTIVREESP